MMLYEHPIYIDFVKRYAFDIDRFAVEVCGVELTTQQIEIARSIEPFGSRTSVSSGHGIGKTLLIAVVSLWHLICYKDSNTLLTAPKVEQVRNLVWKEFANIRNKAIAKGQFAWLFGDDGFVVIEAMRVYIKGSKENWYVIAKTSPKGSPENLAGAHGDYYLLIADEASGIPDENYGVLTGALTDDRNRALLTSQPTRNNGFFYDTHHTLNKNHGGTWNSITTSSIDSPLVGANFILEKRKAYTEEQYKVKVLGQFPDVISGMLIPREAIEKCYTRGRIIEDDEPYGWMLSVDIGGGEGRDYSVATLCRVIGSGTQGDDARRIEVVNIPYHSNTRNIHNFLGDVLNFYRNQDSTIVTAIDVMGMGHGAPSFLESADMMNIYKVRWGKPCFQTENKELFHDMIAHAHVSLQRAIMAGRVSFLTDKHKSRILDEGARIPYDFDSQFRYKILSKQERASKGIPSPDIWDTLAFMFLEGLQYNVNSNYGTETNSHISEKMNKYANAFVGMNDD